MVAGMLACLASLSLSAAEIGAQDAAFPSGGHAEHAPPNGRLPPVVAPGEKTVAALPPPVTPPPYELELKQGGGFTVSLGGRTYRIESSYSYPHGGENRLAAGLPSVGHEDAPPNGRDTQGEDSWRVVTGKLDEKTYRVTAGGEHYSIERRLEVEPTRIMVRDTIHNTSEDVVGIILSNHIDTRGSEDLKPTMMNKLTAFVHAEDNGVGIIALDDLYQLQQRHCFTDGLAALRTQDFGLDKGAAYTIEWAVYPTASGDYYEFINQVRKDEGLNRRVEGSFAFVPRREPPNEEFMDRFNLKYTSIGCLGKPPDDPTVSLEGIEFTEYPEECRLLKESFAETKHMYPITIESIQCGTVRGQQRIVTKNSGIYGWPGDRSLHVVYLYDARGFLIRNDLLSTVDASGVRTGLQLEKDESAAVVRIPVTLQAAEPINFNIRQYDATSVGMALNGRGQVQVRVKSGEFPVKPGDTYQVTAETARNIVAGGNATLAFSLTLDGPTSLRIETMRPRASLLGERP